MQYLPSASRQTLATRTNKDQFVQINCLASTVIDALVCFGTMDTSEDVKMLRALSYVSYTHASDSEGTHTIVQGLQGFAWKLKSYTPSCSAGVPVQ